MKNKLSVICKAANRFYKQGYSRSAAFILAWRLAKETATTKVSGVTHGNRQSILAELVKADPGSVSVELRRESGNLYDSNAISVIVISSGKGYKVGYLPKAAAALIAPIMDAGQAIRAELKGICGGWLEGISYGARLTLAM